MKEKAILFNTEMVEAILRGEKTQTRRIIKPQPEAIYDGFYTTIQLDGTHKIIKSPIKPNDILYVRERFETDTDGKPKYYAGNIEVKHNRTYEQLTKWTPSIYMPKKYARIWLQVTEIQAEHLNSISKEDAKAEGIRRHKNLYYFYPYGDLRDDTYIENDPQISFYSLWVSHFGKKSWEDNPWVWIIKFNVISTTGKPEKI